MKQITENFSFEEFTHSDTAEREGFSEQFTLPESVKENIVTLCKELLEPLRDMLPEGALRVSSGYRCERLNAYVGGKPNSQHLKGQAADVQLWVNGEMKNAELLHLVKDSGLDFDQAIDEHSGAWIHVSYNKGHNRKMVLKIS